MVLVESRHHRIKIKKHILQRSFPNNHAALGFGFWKYKKNTWSHMYTYLTNNMKMLIWMKCHMFKSNEHCMCILISQYYLSYDILSCLLLKDQTLLLKITTALSFDCFCWLTFDENFRVHFKFASNYRIRYSINIIFSWILRIHLQTYCDIPFGITMLPLMIDSKEK